MFLISSLNTGGAQRAFANLSMNLPENWSCDFLINSAEEVSYPHRGRVIDLGLSPQEDKTEFLYLLRVLVKRFFVLLKLKRSGEYKACISGLSSANMVNVLTKTRKCKTIISIRIYMSQAIENTSPIKRHIKRASVVFSNILSDKIVTVSESSKKDLIDNFFADESSTVSIYNGYNLSLMRNLAKSSLSSEENAKLFSLTDTKLLVNIGRLESEKCQIALVRIFSEINRKLPATKLVILGQGRLHNVLETFINKMGLKNKVLLWGFEQNPYRILANSYLFLLTSINEGFPNAMVESMSLGIPIISTDCDSGPREILAPDTDISYKTENEIEMAEYGVLCPILEENHLNEELNYSEKLFSSAVIKLLEDNELYKEYSRRATERAADFSGEKTIQEWLSVVNG